MNDILKGFEIFTEKGKSFRPKISIRKTGQIAFNNAAVRSFGIEANQYVVLMFNKKTKQIAIKLVTGPQQKGVMKLSKAKSNRFVCASAFLKKYKVNHIKTTSFEATWNADHRVAIIDLV